MRIYLAHSSKIDFKNDFYRPIQDCDLHKEHEFIYFCEDPEYKNKSSKEVIKTCDLLIAEMSETSTGMGIEIGWADMLNIPIVVVHRSDTNISGYMHTIAKQVIDYSNPTEMVEKLSQLFPTLFKLT